MANEFDKIFKEESEILIKAIATKVLGIKDFNNTQPVTASLQKTIEREPDWLRRVCHEDVNQDYIFHGEVHGKDQAVILDRNLIYYGLLWYNYHLPVHQVVVYIGRKKKLSKMKALLIQRNMNFRFDIINMHEVPYEIFINSTEPAEVILSILCDFKGQSPNIILPLILERLRELDKGGLVLEKHFVQLEIIANLRNLQPLLTKIMETMPITYDLRKDIRYKQGKLEGKIEGKLEGKIEGKIEAALAKDQTFVISLLSNGISPLEKIADLTLLDLDFVKMTKARFERALKMATSKKYTGEDITKATGLVSEVVEKWVLKK